MGFYDINERWRWVRNAFKSLADMSTMLAEHGPGLMPQEVVDALEREYMTYRENYNSNRIMKFNSFDFFWDVIYWHDFLLVISI